MRLSNRPFERAGINAARPIAAASAGRSTPLRWTDMGTVSVLSEAGFVTVAGVLGVDGGAEVATALRDDQRGIR